MLNSCLQPKKGKLDKKLCEIQEVYGPAILQKEEFGVLCDVCRLFYQLVFRVMAIVTKFLIACRFVSTLNIIWQNLKIKTVKIQKIRYVHIEACLHVRDR